MGYEHIEIEQADRVATLFLNRPGKLNAMSEDMWADIPAAIADLDADENVRAVFRRRFRNEIAALICVLGLEQGYLPPMI